jgi:hypothetical protein
MKFVLNRGVHPEGDIISSEKRGTIIPSTKEIQEARFETSLKSPRVMGKKGVKEKV